MTALLQNARVNMSATSSFMGRQAVPKRPMGAKNATRALSVRVSATSRFEKENPYREEMLATAKYIATRGKGILASGEIRKA